MKTMTITNIMADFLDSIRAYEHESGEAIHFDERESSEFVDMFFNGGGKINIEESNADGENNQMEQYRIVKTAGQVMDEINQMNDGSIMEIYKVQGGFKTKFQSGWTSAPEDIESMNKKAIEKLPIDKVTTKNLDIALRMVGIQLDVNIIDKVIDLVELIENKGGDVTIEDIVSLQHTWSRHSQAFKGD